MRTLVQIVLLAACVWGMVSAAIPTAAIGR